jgi:hypothetical protein
MSLATVIRKGVSIADKVTKSVQGNMILEAWIGQSITGLATYASPITVKCIEDDTQKTITIASGQVITVMSTLTILEAIPSNGASGRHEPIDTRDKITTPSGFVGKVIETPGSVVDPGTGKGFIQSIMLGAR